MNTSFSSRYSRHVSCGLIFLQASDVLVVLDPQVVLDFLIWLLLDLCVGWSSFGLSASGSSSGGSCSYRLSCVAVSCSTCNLTDCNSASASSVLSFICFFGSHHHCSVHWKYPLPCHFSCIPFLFPQCLSFVAFYKQYMTSSFWLHGHCLCCLG